MIEVKQVSGKTVYQRWNIHQRIQHIGIFTSFFLCTFTGIPIKFHHHWYAPLFTKFFGGFDAMLNWHLFAAGVMIVSCFYHLAWQGWCMLSGKAGWGVMPFASDGPAIVNHIKFQLGKSDQPARFDRYSYKEKFDYWAVFWGMFIIGVSGIVMWMPEWGAAILPRWVVDCSRIGHSDEAILAILAIFVWHFYNVHFSPDFFPMNRVWFDGQMDEEAMKHEHPVELDKIQGGMRMKKPVGVTTDETIGG